MELKRYKLRKSATLTKILIVPDGIETYMVLALKGKNKILIVPDGIETAQTCLCKMRGFHFNRTRWN